MAATINSITLVADTHFQHNNLLVRQCDLLIVGILDAVKPDENLGCKSLLKRIFEIKPKYHFFGHIQQDYGEYDEWCKV